jgi:hypothetical protein
MAKSGSSPWRQSRDAMARRKGYRNYYEYRSLYGSGRIAPGGKPTPTGERGLSRGHGGQTRAFLRFLKPGDKIVCDITTVEIRPRGKGRVDRYKLIKKQVILGPANKFGPDRFFELRDLSRKQLVATIKAEIKKGVGFHPAPSKDQRKLVGADEVEGGYEK